MNELPELPKPLGWLHDANGNDPLTFVRGELPEIMSLVHSTQAVYTQSQMRSYALSAVQMERERCAMIALEADVPTFKHGGQEFVDSGRLLTEIAAAIRSPSKEGC